MSPHITYESGVYFKERAETIREMLSQSSNNTATTASLKAETHGHSRLSGLIQRFIEVCPA